MLPNITAISLFIEIDGQLCLAPVHKESGAMFLAMLSAYQGEPTSKGTRLIRLPNEVAKHVHAAGQELEKMLQENGSKSNK